MNEDQSLQEEQENNDNNNATNHNNGDKCESIWIDTLQSPFKDLSMLLRNPCTTFLPMMSIISALTGSVSYTFLLSYLEKIKITMIRMFQQTICILRTNHVIMLNKQVKDRKFTFIITRI